MFEWDPRKAEANAAKHGVSFDDAVTVFLDAQALDGADLQHSSAEARFRRLGRSADGRVLWLSGRYNAEVYALSTRTGRLLARIPVGASPHGLCVWPQPGRYSIGHTGNMR